MIGCSSKSILRSEEDDVSCSSRGCASTISVEGGVEGGEDVSGLLSVLSLLLLAVISVVAVVMMMVLSVLLLLLLSSVPFDTFIV